MKNLLTLKEIKTIKYYDKEAPKWALEHLTNKFWGSMDKFYNLLPSGKVIEIGCGGGRDARDYLIDRYDYIGTDISDELLKVAKKQNPNNVFLKHSVYDLNFPKNSFDGFATKSFQLNL